jgi:hypothetical protein
MKKFPVTIIIFIALLIGGCSTSSLDRDIRTMANLFCEEAKLRSKVNEGNEAAKKELDELQVKMKKLSDEFEKKYKDKNNEAEVERKADKIYAEVMANCK